jgi:hypothetical protein
MATIIKVELAKGSDEDFLVVQGVANHVRKSVSHILALGVTNRAFAESLNLPFTFDGQTEQDYGNKIRKAIENLAVELDCLAADMRVGQRDKWVIGTSKDCPVVDTCKETS